MSSCSSSRKKPPSDDLANEQIEEIYQRAKRALDNGNYFFALDYYRALEANFPYGQVTEQAKLDMIFALDKSNQIEEAIEAADNFIQLYPTHANVDYAYYMKGSRVFKRKRTKLTNTSKAVPTKYATLNHCVTLRPRFWSLFSAFLTVNMQTMRNSVLCFCVTV